MIRLLSAFLACADPGWTPEAAVAPTLERLDADRSGEVDKREYEAVLFHGAPFGEVDADGDGELSLGELQTIIAGADPSRMQSPRPATAAANSGKSRPGKERPGKQGPGKEGPGKEGAGGAGAAQRRPGAPALKVEDRPADSRQLRSQSQWVVRMILESLRAEVLAVNPTQPVPTDQDIKLAAGSADIRTSESRAVLQRLEAASDAVGTGFPESLRATVLVGVPVTPSLAVEPSESEGLPGAGAPPMGGPTGPPRPIEPKGSSSERK